ncbi:hypothetical protein AYY16_13165 [Morganella psychrotolerans]|nr:hypothetical protein AYY16_13165 [Morganella psychrotolerans]
MTTSNTYTDKKVSNINTTIDNSRVSAINTSNHYTNNRVSELETRMDNKFSSVERQLDKNSDRANAGIASVAAMANIPYISDKTFSMGLGAGNYRNGNAVAFGGQYSIDGNVNIRSSVSWNNEDSAVYGAGIAVGF